MSFRSVAIQGRRNKINHVLEKQAIACITLSTKKKRRNTLDQRNADWACGTDWLRVLTWTLIPILAVVVRTRYLRRARACLQVQARVDLHRFSVLPPEAFLDRQRGQCCPRVIAIHPFRTHDGRTLLARENVFVVIRRLGVFVSLAQVKRRDYLQLDAGGRVRVIACLLYTSDAADE